MRPVCACALVGVQKSRFYDFLLFPSLLYEIKIICLVLLHLPVNICMKYKRSSQLTNIVISRVTFVLRFELSIIRTKSKFNKPGRVIRCLSQAENVFYGPTDGRTDRPSLDTFFSATFHARTLRTGSFCSYFHALQHISVWLISKKNLALARDAKEPRASN